MAAQSSASKLGTSLISSRPNLLQQQSRTPAPSTRPPPIPATKVDSTIATPRGLSLETKLLARQVLQPDQNLESYDTSHPFSRSMDWLLNAATECENPRPVSTDRERPVESVKLASDSHDGHRKHNIGKSNGHGHDTHTTAKKVIDIWALPRTRKTAT